MPSSLNNKVNPALESLHDIAMPGDISQWPMAPGWWIVIILTAAAVIFLGRYLRKIFQARQREKLWQQTLQLQYSRLTAISDEKAFEQAALTTIQQLTKKLSNNANVKTADALVSQLSQWMSPQQAEFLAIQRYQAGQAGSQREQYLNIIQRLLTQLEGRPYVGA